MKISRLKLDKPILDFLKSEGFVDLYPPQGAAVKAGLLRGKSLLIATPTASGKTLVAIMAMLSYLSKNHGKAVYLSPLRALALEKYSEFKRMESINMDNPVRVAISTGDFEGVTKNLRSGNLLVMTNEKMDAIIRNTPGWLDDVGLIIADEIHLVGDPSRGPTLEMILTRMRMLDSHPQIVGLSATITNADEIARWLQCNLVEDEWRPVPLVEGTCVSGQVKLYGGRGFSIKPSGAGMQVDLGIHSVAHGGQSLIFAETRRRAASFAKKAAPGVSKLLEDQERVRLEAMSKKILAKSQKTKMVETLAGLVRLGVGFHHAGLDKNCRELVEEGFRAGTIKMISSTPTLAAGVNLPARRVIIASIDRYDFKTGYNVPISVMEYKQLCGRAGRPQYDTRGEAITVVRDQYMVKSVKKRYMDGSPEPIESRLNNEKSLRNHVLATIVSRRGIDRDALSEFFSETLAGQQPGRTVSESQISAQTSGHYTRYSVDYVPDLKHSLEMAVKYLVRHKLVMEKNGNLVATPLGRRISRMYIDPLTAMQFGYKIMTIKYHGEHSREYLQIICGADEFFPKFGITETMEVNLKDMIDTYIPRDMHEDKIRHGRSVLALNFWIDERSELQTSEILGVEAGDMHRMVETADWLLYCLREIAAELGRRDLVEDIYMLRQRMKYGVRKELLELVRIRGIGRIRARSLYKNKIRDAADLHKIPLDRLAGISKIGPALARSIKSQTRRSG